MESSPPVKLKGVSYYLRTGSLLADYCWSGDLVITSAGIYYFPVVDLEERRKKENNQALIVRLAFFELPRLISGEKSFFENLHTSVESDQETIARLNAYFERKKEGEGPFLANSLLNDEHNSLPKPMLFKLQDIREVKLKRNLLHFNTIADTHDFRFRRKDTGCSNSSSKASSCIRLDPVTSSRLMNIKHLLCG